MPQFLPETFRSWADAGWGNNNLITIEICESDDIRYTGGANYTVLNAAKFEADIRRGYQTAVELCAKICKERGWNPKKKLGNGMYLISSHAEGNRAGLSSNHGDPDHVWHRFGLTMDKFREDVAERMQGAFDFKPGKKVKLLQPIALRTGITTRLKKGGYAKYAKLSDSTKKRVIRLANNNCQLRKGTVVIIAKVRENYKGDTWFKLKNGWWIPVIVDGTGRVKRV